MSRNRSGFLRMGAGPGLCTSLRNACARIALAGHWCELALTLAQDCAEARDEDERAFYLNLAERHSADAFGYGRLMQGFVDRGAVGESLLLQGYDAAVSTAAQAEAAITLAGYDAVCALELAEHCRGEGDIANVQKYLHAARQLSAHAFQAAQQLQQFGQQAGAVSS